MAPRIDIADYDAVVSEIYEAALNPARWELALTSLVNRFGGDRWDIAMLLWERVAPAAGRFVGSSGVHLMAQQAYVHGFAGSNEWSLRGHDLAVGTVIHSDHLVDRGQFTGTPFYREFLANYGLEVGVLALLDRHGADHLCLCLPGPADKPSRTLETAVRMLLPHIQRSVRISRRIGEVELSARSARAVLDRAPSPVLLLDDKARVLYANAQAEALFAAGYLLRRGDTLLLPERKAAARLAALAQAHDGPHCQAFMLEPDGQPPVGAMALRIEDDPARANPDFQAARIMIVAGRNHVASFANVDNLRDWFGLTPAEARLAATLAEGGSLEDFAATRGITLNAARFLLKGIFAKTGCNRQAQLVARLQATPLQWHIGRTMAELPDPIDRPDGLPTHLGRAAIEATR